MGESSACLMRSFSHPSNTSREIESKEGNPMRALTESISFGRFMPESLAWEKWSAFNHNRYLEEVEQFSKPGSVAQKKAYFEAYYKKRAAMKAAALLQEANAAANNVPEAEAADEVPSSSHAGSKFSKATDDAVICEQELGSVHDVDPVHSADANAGYVNVQMDNIQNLREERVEEIIEQDVAIEHSIQVEDSKQFENAVDYEMILTPEEILPNKEAAGEENVPLPNNKRQISSPSKSLNQSKASKLSKSSTKKSSSTRPGTATNVTPNSKNSAVELMDKKRATPKSTHMSINFVSRLQETNKSYLRVAKDSSPTLENPTRASITGVSKLLPSMIRRSEARRTKLDLNKSISGGILPALSSGCSKSSSEKGSKARPPLVSSPFSFRSAERASKRKEFFQQLEEKKNAEDAEEKHVQGRPKEKVEHDLKKLRQSTVFKGKPNGDLQRGLQSPSNPIKKIPLTRPRSPKLGRRSTPSVVPEASFQLPRRPAVKAENSKLAIQKSNHSTMRSVISLPKKKAHENASPNIQR